MNGGSFPIAPHAWFHGYLDDDVPEERELGMKFGQHQMHSCGQVWVFGSVISSGMQSEISSALLLGKKVRYFTNDCQELRK
ncbi:hypothetical protein FACS1894184_02990 [Clostridia bacterium]|nr:hypothetical protein FACS1894184_02990 [Clostridia bacterium]